MHMPTRWRVGGILRARAGNWTRVSAFAVSPRMHTMIMLYLAKVLVCVCGLARICPQWSPESCPESRLGQLSRRSDTMSSCHRNGWGQECGWSWWGLEWAEVKDGHDLGWDVCVFRESWINNTEFQREKGWMCSFYVKSCNRFVFRSSHSSFKQLENI